MSSEPRLPNAPCVFRHDAGPRILAAVFGVFGGLFLFGAPLAARVPCWLGILALLAWFFRREARRRLEIGSDRFVVVHADGRRDEVRFAQIASIVAGTSVLLRDGRRVSVGSFAPSGLVAAELERRSAESALARGDRVEVLEG